MDDGDTMSHPILVPSCLQEIDDANAKVGAERNPQKTQVIYYVSDLEAAPLEWRIHEVQNMAKVSTVTAGSLTLGVSVGRRQHIADQLLTKADVIRAMHERVHHVSTCSESLGVSRTNHILQVHGCTILQEQRAAEIFDEVGQRSLARLFPGFTEDSMTQATLSADPSGIGYKRARDIAAPAAKPRIQAMVQDAVTAGLLPKQTLETRLAAVIETATSTYLGALDDEN